MQGGANAERVKSLTSGIQLIGQREFLIKGGWEMWKDNPLVGVGSGNYQHTLLVSYLWTLPWWAKTTLSHTSFISILAELGIVGVGMGWGYSTRARARTDRSNTSVAASRPCVVKGRERMR